jgi:hypothetical protein
MVTHQGELASNNTRPENTVVHAHRRLVSRPEHINTPQRAKTDPLRQTSRYRAASLIAAISSHGTRRWRPTSCRNRGGGSAKNTHTTTAMCSNDGTDDALR